MKRLLMITIVLLTFFLGCEKQLDEPQPASRVAMFEIVLPVDENQPGNAVLESLGCARIEFQQNFNELRRHLQTSPPARNVQAVTASEAVRQ